MRTLVIQFNGKSGKDAAPRKILTIFKIPVSVIPQELLDFSKGAFNLSQARKGLFTPNSTRLIQDLEEKVLFAGEMIVESAFEVFAASKMSLIEVLKYPFKENSLRDSWMIVSFRFIVNVLRG